MQGKQRKDEDLVKLSLPGLGVAWPCLPGVWAGMGGGDRGAGHEGCKQEARWLVREADWGSVDRRRTTCRQALTYTARARPYKVLQGGCAGQGRQERPTERRRGRSDRVGEKFEASNFGRVHSL